MAKNRFRAKPAGKNTPKNNKALEREDDQIAPKAVAHSIDALQKWAMCTANITRGSHKNNEAQTVERIQDRYANESLSPEHHKDGDQHAFPATALQKLKHPISPTSSLQLETVQSGCTMDTDDRRTKRRRSKLPETCRFSEDDDNANSSEWSFPAEDEVVITKVTAKKDMKARTYTEID